MITLKLGFASVSLAAAFWATTAVEPQPQVQSQQSMPTVQALSDHIPDQMAQPASAAHSLAVPAGVAPSGSLMPPCPNASCDIGTLMSMAFTH